MYLVLNVVDYTWDEFEVWDSAMEYAKDKLPVLVFIQETGMVEIDTDDELTFQMERGPVIELSDLEDEGNDNDYN